MSKMFNSAVISKTMMNKNTNEQVDLYSIVGNVARIRLDDRMVRDNMVKVCNINFVVHEDGESKSASVAFWGKKAEEMNAKLGVGDFISVEDCVFANGDYTYNGENRKSVTCKSLANSSVKMDCRLLKKASNFVEYDKARVSASSKSSVSAKAETKVEAKVVNKIEAKSALAVVNLDEEELPW